MILISIAMFQTYTLINTGDFVHKKENENLYTLGGETPCRNMLSFHSFVIFYYSGLVVKIWQLQECGDKISVTIIEQFR